ncbi:hypothetical protein QPK87_02800 [Kamptonema cortianum]|uniref:DUF1400 domain-containing protein n=1 Tax=Geitlerinema calcuttense NRMC-F 0142 TaxID=2922238 RepID=A0ABT7LVM6_9CYAN|nr:hypothetical protein [Geitlerinema calcuttense]MDK3155511.1 hypothetical protein [Kamptonema cortianum]MDL5047257.1 hypothetical protein [Oscillatoria amoena NRMC-F 0135]MDL5056044.1 hypothetical protein [Geitlerinema calcuttense NRMC-F 0142]
MKRRVKTVYQAIAATIGISLLWLGAPVKAYPELQYEHLQLNTSLERCASYAQTVLERKGFRTLPPQFSSATGYLPGIKAVIDCTPLDPKFTQATIIVAGESDRTSEEILSTVNLLYKAMNGEETVALNFRRFRETVPRRLF